jgi:hypothetical protein
VRKRIEELFAFGSACAWIHECLSRGVERAKQLKSDSPAKQRRVKQTLTIRFRQRAILAQEYSRSCELVCRFDGGSGQRRRSHDSRFLGRDGGGHLVQRDVDVAEWPVAACCFTAP